MATPREPSSSRRRALSSLEKRLGHAFADRALLEQALTHSSATADPLADNERMEFLGDAVLDLVVGERIFRAYAQADEGRMTRLKSSVVSTGSLARCGRALALERYAVLGRGIAARELPPSVYANLVESLIAAVYLDDGLETVRETILKDLGLGDEIEEALLDGGDSNYKSRLQEYAQRVLGQAPDYRVLATQGPEHEKVFRVAAVVGDVTYPPAEGNSKKEAEQAAAARALASLGEGPDDANGPRPGRKPHGKV